MSAPALKPCLRCGGALAVHENDWADPVLWSWRCTSCVLFGKEFATEAEAVADANLRPLEAMTDDAAEKARRLKVLAQKASAGPWSHSPSIEGRSFCAQVWKPDDSSLVTMDGIGEQTSHDAAFIAGARNDIEAVCDALLATPSELRAEIDRLRAALGNSAAQFRFYAQEHRKKQTPDGDAKAETNEHFAAICDAALSPKTAAAAAGA